MRLKDIEKMLRKRCQLYRKRYTPSTTTPVRSVTSASDMLGTIQDKTFQRFGLRSRSIQNSKNSSQDKILPKESYFDCKSEENLPMDFCKHTSLHGLKYIAERKQHLIERVFWAIAFLISLVAAYYMISDVWQKYRNNSVIIAFAPFDTKIEEIPFPAITICNMNKVLRSKAMQFMNDAKGKPGIKTTEARENLFYLNHVCSSSKSFTKAFNYSANRGKIDKKSLQAANVNKNNYDGGKQDLWQFFLQASQSCESMILKCIWQEEVKNCSELFTSIETDYGTFICNQLNHKRIEWSLPESHYVSVQRKCCTFNMIPPSQLHKLNMTETNDEPWEWNGDALLQKGQEKEYPPFPRRQKVPGKSFGLSILLNPDLDEYFCTTSDAIGYRIVSHLPINVPHIGDLGSAIKPNSEVFINIRPAIIIAGKDTIGDFSLEQRDCYFNEEQKLGYYNYYSSTNCFDECVANLTYEFCKCRRHYQPGDDTKPLCGPKEFHCASNIKKKFVGNYNAKCKMCIPTCTEIAYHTETTYTTLQPSEVLWTDNKGLLAPWAHKNTSIVHIYFGEGSTNAKLRKELYSAVDLIANFGGLMSLSLGFSCLSVIEVIYFLTLRAWFRSRRNRLENNARTNGATNDTNAESNSKQLNNDLTCIPIYKSPESAKSYNIPNKVNNPGAFNSRQRKNGPNINHIIYSVAFAPPEDTIANQNRVMNN